MINVIRLFYLVFGLLALGGGVQAFITVRSKASLVAGGISGLWLGVAAWFTVPPNPLPGLLAGLFVTLALAGRFLPIYFKERAWWPAGAMGWLGALGLLLSLAGLIAS